MRDRGRKAWNDLYSLLQGSELTAETYLIKLEIVGNLKKGNPAMTDLEIAVLLLVIADSNLKELVESNG